MVQALELLPDVTGCSYLVFQPGLNVAFLSAVVFGCDDSLIVGRKN